MVENEEMTATLTPEMKHMKNEAQSRVAKKARQFLTKYLKRQLVVQPRKYSSSTDNNDDSISFVESDYMPNNSDGNTE